MCGVLPPWRPRKSPTSDVGDVDGVPYILSIASKVVVLGTGLVSNDERDKFKDQAQASRPPARSRARGRGRVQNSRLWPLLPQLLPPLKADEVMIPLLMAMALLMLAMPTLHRLL